MVVEIVMAPVDLVIRKVVHDATMEQLAYLLDEVEEWDKDLYEYCRESNECKLQMLRIALETASIILRKLLEDSIEDEWKIALEVYESLTKGSRYHT